MNSINILKKVIPSAIKPAIRDKYHEHKHKNKQKIFCIGLNKTGTTSLKKEMELQGFVVGNQRRAELLFDDWVKKDFSRIIKYCKTAQFFQDVPFSLPYTFIAIDQAFPGSKFILTIRDDAESWYNSLIRFHGKLFGNGKIPPTTEDLKSATYIYKGFPYHSRTHVLNAPENDLYNKEILIDFYETHNKAVTDYFRFRKNDFLEINLKEDNSYEKFCSFLNIVQTKDKFPWENKT